MLNLSATTVLVIGLAVVLVLAVAAIAYQTATRLDRLHVRTDLSYQALESALARRAAVARAVAGSLSDKQAGPLRRAADRAENATREDREIRENELSSAINALDVELLPRSVVAEIADADTRVIMARRFYNDAVRDTRALRGRRFVRWLHLGGTAAMPGYVDIVDRSGMLPVALLARTRNRRVSGRVILLDPAGAVLLVRGHDPRHPAEHFWFTTGGGIDPGENPAAAAIREVYEETGRVLTASEIVGPLYRREADFTFDGDVIESEEIFFGAVVDRFEPRPTALTDLERRSIDDFRWCSPEEIRAFTAPVYPAALADLLPAVGVAVRDGKAPDSPVNVE